VLNTTDSQDPVADVSEATATSPCKQSACLHNGAVPRHWQVGTSGVLQQTDPGEKAALTATWTKKEWSAITNLIVNDITSNSSSSDHSNIQCIYRHCLDWSHLIAELHSIQKGSLAHTLPRCIVRPHREPVRGAQVRTNPALWLRPTLELQNRTRRPSRLPIPILWRSFHVSELVLKISILTMSPPRQCEFA
jgi:hypothetical protein